MTTNQYSLAELGWSAFFQQQLSLEEYESFSIGRIMAVHRAHIDVATEHGATSFPTCATTQGLTVGDWILFDNEQHIKRGLERRSSFYRKSPGSEVSEQLIAANVDTVFIVCSLNRNYSLNRIERYLALVNQSGADPVIVLTKADQCEQLEQMLTEVQSLDPLLHVVALDARDAQQSEVLGSYCTTGKTITLLGSSGVGKSTLINTLLHDDAQQTGAIRGADDKGRHTTTTRSLVVMPDGGLLMDTPGMRELQLADCEQGVAETFNDVTDLAQQCRFSDCQHVSEPGCAVLAAIESGALTQRRLVSYQKLLREQAINGATLAEKRSQEKQLSRMYKRVISESQHLKKEGF